MNAIQAGEAIAAATAPIGNAVDYVFETCLGPALADRPAYIVDGAETSFRVLHERVCQVGHLLRSLGIGVGDRVMFSVADGIDFPALFFGGMKIGAVTIPLNTFLKARDYRYYANDSGAEVLVVDATLLPLIEEIKADLKGLRHIIVSGKRVEGYPFLPDLLDGQPTALETVPRDNGDMAFWLYSSGSTGDPKGVVHTHAHLYWATELFGLGAQGIRAGDVIQCPPKMFFAYGLGNQLYFPLRAGATVIVNPGPITPRAIWDLWLTHKPTITMSVPTLFAGMLRLAEAEIGQEAARAALSRCRFCVSGGEVLPPALLKRWTEYTGVTILDGVGTTELTHMFILNRPDDPVPGSCGRLVRGYAAELVDEDDQPVPQGEIGNLRVFGPSAAAAYWNKPEKTAAVMGKGGVLTGDKYYQDADGFYFYVGRADDMLRVGAIWVSPAEVENAIAEHPEVIECAVVGHPDDEGMTKPRAYIILRDGVPGDVAGKEGELREFVRARLAHIKCPRWFDFVSELPKTATGKIQRFRLRDRTG